MRFMVAFTLVVLLCSVALPVEQQKKGRIHPKVVDKNWAGIYALDGIEDGEKYTGCVYIRKAKGIYIITMCWEDMYDVASGVGQVVDGMLCIGWTNTKGTVKGNTVYRKSENSIVGTWAVMPGSGTIVREELVQLVKK